MGVKEEVVQKKRLDILFLRTTFFLFKKKLKAIPTLHCCNTIDPPYPILL